MFCSKCGNENELNAEFCQNCGAKLELSGQRANLDETDDLKSIESQKMQLASLSSRIGAYLIDMVIYLILCFGIGFVIGIILINTENTQLISGGTTVLLNYSFSFIVLFAYFIILEGPLVKGRTIGKRALNLRVVKKDQSTIGYGASFVRNILRLIDGLFFYIIGIILISDNNLNQRLGDRAANTIVIKEN